MRHVRPSELLVPDRRVIRPQSFIPGLSPTPKIIGAQREVNPGSQSWTSPGTFNWTVPLFNNLSIAVLGAGGGGSGSAWSDFGAIFGNPNYPAPAWNPGGAGAAGGYGQFYVPATGLNMVAYGGAGGQGNSQWNQSSPMGAGSSGTGQGGNSANYTGSGNGGGTYGYCWMYGFIYAQGPYSAWSFGGPGGTGGRCDSNFTIGQIPQGSVATIVVQGGGGPGYQINIINGTEQQGQGDFPNGAFPTGGGAAAVYVSWS
jgi:hypothetical protein